MYNVAKFLARYFISLRVGFHEFIALLGFIVFLLIILQLFSGTMIAYSLVPESMYIPLVREEEDCEDLYTDDFFWMHERGVDLIVIFIFLHLCRKLFLNIMDIEQEYAWKSGVILYLLLQLVIFLGLVLCCTHLSDITLLIAANAFNTFCFFIGKLNWLIFPDQTLNTDTIIRLAYLHYIMAFILAYFGVKHGVDMHYDWKSNGSADHIKQQLTWYDEALLSELSITLDLLMVVGLLCLYLYQEPEALSYEIFMWGDIGMTTDIRFYGVAPHWYFRPYMAWLLACPFHYLGLLGLILFFISFYFQPNILGRSEWGWYNTFKVMILVLYFEFINLLKRVNVLERITSENTIFYQITFSIFMIVLWYTFSYLPFGRFFQRVGGNDASLLAYVYLFIYLSTTFLRLPLFYHLFKLSRY